MGKLKQILIFLFFIFFANNQLFAQDYDKDFDLSEARKLFAEYLTLGFGNNGVGAEIKGSTIDDSYLSAQKPVQILWHNSYKVTMMYIGSINNTSLPKTIDFSAVEDIVSYRDKFFVNGKSKLSYLVKLSFGEGSFAIFGCLEKNTNEKFAALMRYFVEKKKKDSLFFQSDLSNFKPLADRYHDLVKKPDLKEEVRKLLIQATVFTEQKNFDNAIKLYQQAISIEPLLPSGYFNLALLLAQTTRFEEAVVYMQKYLMLMPGANDARSSQDKIYEWQLRGRSRSLVPDKFTNIQQVRDALFETSASLWLYRNNDKVAIGGRKDGLPISFKETCSWKNNYKMVIKVYPFYYHTFSSEPAGYDTTQAPEIFEIDFSKTRMKEETRGVFMYKGSLYLVKLYQNDLCFEFGVYDKEEKSRIQKIFSFLQETQQRDSLNYHREIDSFYPIALQYTLSKKDTGMSETVRKYMVQAAIATNENDIDLAIELYDEANHLEPTYPDAYYNKAFLLSQRIRYPEAILAMKKYLMLVPDRKDARAAQDKIYYWEIQNN